MRAHRKDPTSPLGTPNLRRNPEADETLVVDTNNRKVAKMGNGVPRDEIIARRRRVGRQFRRLIGSALAARRHALWLAKSVRDRVPLKARETDASDQIRQNCYSAEYQFNATLGKLHAPAAAVHVLKLSIDRLARGRSRLAARKPEPRAGWNAGLAGRYGATWRRRKALFDLGQ